MLLTIQKALISVELREADLADGEATDAEQKSRARAVRTSLVAVSAIADVRSVLYRAPPLVAGSLDCWQRYCIPCGLDAVSLSLWVKGHTRLGRTYALRSEGRDVGRPPQVAPYAATELYCDGITT